MHIIIIRPQRMHKMQTFAIDDPVKRLRCTNTAKRIRVLLGWRLLWTQEHYIRRDSRFCHCFNGAFAKLLWPLVIS